MPWQLPVPTKLTRPGAEDDNHDEPEFQKLNLKTILGNGLTIWERSIRDWYEFISPTFQLCTFLGSSRMSGCRHVTCVATATMGMELMAPRTDRTTRISSAVTTDHAAKGSVFVNLTTPGNLKKSLGSSGMLECSHVTASSCSSSLLLSA